MEHKGRTFDVLGQLGSLRRYARSLTRNADEAEDLVHDALVKAYERKSTFRRGANLRTWLFSILHNTHVDHIRKARMQEKAQDEAVAAIELSLPAAQDHVVRLNQVRDAFFSLPEEQRAALHLVTIEDLSYQEAASALGVPVGTLMSRISRARAHLREFEDRISPAFHLRLIGGSNNENR